LPDISPGPKTANIWFDNMVSDWMVRSRINASLESVQSTESAMQQLIADLIGRRAAIATELQRVNAEHDSVLVAE